MDSASLSGLEDAVAAAKAGGQPLRRILDAVAACLATPDAKALREALEGVKGAFDAEAAAAGLLRAVRAARRDGAPLSALLQVSIMARLVGVGARDFAGR